MNASSSSPEEVATTNHQLIVPSPSSAAVEEKEQHDWVTLMPSILERRQLKCTEQTPESARHLIELGLLGNFTRSNNNSYMSSRVEESLLESFVEDDYDGALHLTTLEESTRSDDDKVNNNKPIVGFVFWREIPQEEMQEWIHWENLSKKLMVEQQQQQQQQQQQHEEDQTTLATPLEEGGQQPQQEKGAASESLANLQRNKRRRMRQSIQLVRDESVRWLEVAGNTKRQSLKATTTTGLHGMVQPPPQLMERLTHSWVKLELLAVHPDYWNQHIGTLLLACAMYQAYQKGDDHMILHVAGGQDNVPAIRLYDKFGFLPVPQGTVFHKPDKDLFVLGHVGQSLQRLCWPALEV